MALQALVMWIGRSLRISWLGKALHDRVLVEQGPVIYAFWHGQQLGLLFLNRHRSDLEVLVSLSSDGDLLAQVLALSGLSCVRGSSSRGGAEALDEMIERLSRGQSIALAPDGPRGPKGSAAPGALALARWSGRPIVPLAIQYRSAWRLGSWDEFLIPRPWTRAFVGFGAPLWVDRAGDLSPACRELERRLDSLTQELRLISRL